MKASLHSLYGNLSIHNFLKTEWLSDLTDSHMKSESSTDYTVMMSFSFAETSSSTFFEKASVSF